MVATPSAGDEELQRAIVIYHEVLQRWFDSLPPSKAKPQRRPGRYNTRDPGVQVCQYTIEPIIQVAQVDVHEDMPQPSLVEVPPVPERLRSVANDLAAIVAMKGYLLLTNYDVRRFYETAGRNDNRQTSGQADAQAYASYVVAFQLDPTHEHHVFGLGIAFYQLSGVDDETKLQELSWLIDWANEHATQSLRIRGLQGFVNAYRARRTNALDTRREFLLAARSDFKTALKSSSQLSQADRTTFEPSYLISLSSVDLDLAFIMAQLNQRRDIARRLLLEGIQCADDAIKYEWAVAPSWLGSPAETHRRTLCCTFKIARATTARLWLHSIEQVHSLMITIAIRDTRD